MSSMQRTISRALAVKGMNKKQKALRKEMRRKLKDKEKSK